MEENKKSDEDQEERNDQSSEDSDPSDEIESTDETKTSEEVTAEPLEKIKEKPKMDQPDDPVAALEPALEEQKPIEVLDGRRSIGRFYITLGVVALILLLAGLIAWQAFSFINEEETAWRLAEGVHSEESWQEYMTWADEVVEGGGLRAIFAQKLTSMGARTLAAAEHALEARAEEASAREDWDALCEIVHDHAESGAAMTATKGLYQRIDRGKAAFRHLAKRRNTPADVVTAVDAALEAARAAPCSEGAVIRIGNRVERAEAFGVPIGGGKTVADVVSAVDLEERERAVAEKVAAELRAATAGALKTQVASAGDDASGLLDVRVTSTFRPHDRFLTPSGKQLPGVELEVRVEVTAPSLPEPSGDDSSTARNQREHPSKANLPQTFAMEFFREDRSENEEGMSRIYGRAVDQLFPHVGEHFRRILGLSHNVRDTAATGSCARVPPIQVNQVVSGNTRNGNNIYYGSCEDYIEENYDDYGDGYYENDQIIESELIYRLVVPTRSNVAVAVDSDFEPIVYIRRECRSIASEVACELDGKLEVTLDEGVYYIFVDTAQDDVPGPFTLVAALRSDEQVDRACSSSEPLTSGSSTSSNTAGGQDDLSGSCGGVGASERVYTLDVPERSRLRCVQQASFAPALYVRSDCSDRETEVACEASYTERPISIATIVEPGQHTIVADGSLSEAQGSFELTCELAPPQGAENAPADSCESPGTIEGAGPINVDTFLARDDFRGSCGGNGASDQVFRLEVTSATRLRASWPTSGPRGVLYVRSACDGSEIACARNGTLIADLAAGTHYLVVDGSSATQFGSGTVTLALDDLERVCATGVPLRPGQVVRGELPPRHGRFRGSCSGRRDGSEVVHLLTLEQRSRVSLRAVGNASLGIYVRRACTEGELACTRWNATAREATIERELAPGHYYVFVDHDYTTTATYELNVEVQPIE